MAQKILVVDDRLFMLRLIQHHLERAGYEPIAARSTEEALDAVTQHNPNLVVVDDLASEADLAPALERIRQTNAEPIPMIRMTDQPPQLDATARDGEVVFTKPFSPTQFLAEIKRLIPKPADGA